MASPVAPTRSAIGDVRAPPKRTAGAWKGYLTIGVVAVVADGLLTRGGSPRIVPPLVAQATLVLVILLGIKTHGPALRRPLLVLAAGEALCLGANVFWYPSVAGMTRPLPFPSTADALFIGAYLLIIVGLLLLAIRAGSWSGSGSIDALIVTLGVAAVMWIVVIYPVWRATALSSSARLVAIAYPFIDIGILAATLQLLFLARRDTFSYLLILGFAGTQFAGDVVFSVLQLRDTFGVDSASPLLWMASYAFLGALVLRPTMSTATGPATQAGLPGAPTLRIALVGVAELTGPVILVWAWASGRFAEAAVTTGITVGLLTLAAVRVGTLVRGLLSEKLRLEGALDELSQRDALTGLSNRQRLTAQLTSAIERRVRHGGGVALFALDIDRFKVINDSLGPEAGDHVLTCVARRLETITRPGDLVSRLGADEFAIVVEQSMNDDEARQMADRILGSLREPILVGGRPLTIRASVGFCTGDATSTPEAMLQSADEAMSAAKVRGGARVDKFHGTMQSRAVRHLEIEMGLPGALEHGEFRVVYQPIVSLHTGDIVGAEALIRWTHPRIGPVSPLEFIPIAEVSANIGQIGDWMLHQSLGTLQRYPATPVGPPLEIHVNVSPRQLSAQFAQDVERALRHRDLAGDRLVVELTETALMRADNDALECLSALRDRGVKVAVDDFGTGLSSLARVANLPIDEIKIDKTFVDRLETPSGRAVVNAICVMARPLGFRLVAEGIENPSVIRALRAMGCEYGQGFYFARPLSPTQMEAALAGRLEIGRVPEGLAMLVADRDNRCSVVRRTLLEEGFSVVEVDMDSNLVDLVAAEQPDLVVVCGASKNSTAFEVAGGLKRNPILGSTPVIHVLPGTTDYSIHLTSQTGLDSYLQPDFSGDELRDTISKVLVHS